MWVQIIKVIIEHMTDVSREIQQILPHPAVKLRQYITYMSFMVFAESCDEYQCLRMIRMMKCVTSE